MRRLAVMNQKGGSGKTTTAINLAAALAERKKRVLLLDLDPQASATLWLGLSGETHSEDLFAAHLGHRSLLEFLYQTSTPHLQMIPSCFSLFHLTEASAKVPGHDTFLRQQVAGFPADAWDYMIFDCCPDFNALSRGGLMAADEVLIPVEAHFLALQGVTNLLRIVTSIQERGHPELRINGILPCRVDARARHTGEVVSALREQFGSLVFRTVIRENIRLAESPSFHQPITEYDPRSHGAEDYRALAQEVLRQKIVN
jgi:chromosome partitioning protein